MRYAICFTPPMGDPLSAAAASWLGRSVYSGEPVEFPSVAGLTVAEIAFHTAVPRRFGFHAMIMAPFSLDRDMDEAQLLKALMHFTSAETPFELERMEAARLSQCWGLVPQVPSHAMHLLAARVVQAFDRFRAPLSEDEIERSDPDRLTAPQFTNLHRWGDPYVMDEYRFHMTLTGPLNADTARRLEAPLREHFDPHLTKPLAIDSLALFLEQDPGAPMRVHSQHPLGKISARPRGDRSKRATADGAQDGAAAPLALTATSVSATL
ncbi:DUF1045 domain-containing protein [Sinorhizobium numidicum]|uniref:DUF1045 domain-containing protein n=1 Tax=Sinorhizobium numidicum TaxID=680248 RepID=A0ABY8CX80_9HYPH|nr:DUF1045 domain-containing protein [Sinorhizobium numidicum]WEX76593.1 DUF1045 domain-containing protein [Sinorhizobium numidicum]WEX83254.1 DUF1045 domain-containing protein [Sinorhizobium numidicum]